MTTLDTLAHATTPALLDVRDVAALLNCSPLQVSRLAAAGRMPPPLKLGTLVRWRRQDILSWIAAGCPSCRKTHQQVGSAGHGDDGKHAFGQKDWLDLLTALISFVVNNTLGGNELSPIGGLVVAAVILLLKFVGTRLGQR